MDAVTIEFPPAPPEDLFGGLPAEQEAELRLKLAELRYSTYLDEWKAAQADRDVDAQRDRDWVVEDRDHQASHEVDAAKVAGERAVAAATVANNRAVETAAAADERARYLIFLNKYLEVAAGSLDRSLKRAEQLVAIIAALAAVYQFLIGPQFFAEGTAPETAQWPSVFLGIALLLSAVYYAFLRRSSSTRRLLPAEVDSEPALISFMEWTFAGVLARAWALRGAIVALGAAILVMPVPFVIDRNYAKVELPWIGEAPTLVVVAFAALAIWVVAEVVYRQTTSGTALPADAEKKAEE